MASALTLLIIPNKHFLLALYRVGVQSKDSDIHWPVLCQLTPLQSSRCTALPKDLDGQSTRRCREHTGFLAEHLELQDLWDNYGVVGDVIVRSVVFLCSHSIFFVTFRCYLSLIIANLPSPVTSQPLV
jgi:hypothetical protein